MKNWLHVVLDMTGFGLQSQADKGLSTNNNVTESLVRCRSKIEFQDISTFEWVHSKTMLQNSLSESKKR